MQQFFATAGYRVEFAQHGGDALTLVQHAADLVLLDLMMPGMNGVEVLQRILALRATLPVIIVTARADATLAEQTRALGAFAYVTKPFEFAYLARIVHLALTRSGEGAGGGAH